MLIRKIILFMILVVILTGCESLRYYTQAVCGQISVLNKRRPIKPLLIDPATPEKQKNKLRLVLNLREFAENELHLPVNNHYLTFVKLNRPYVIWNVYAAPEFSFIPKSWCYPIVGCAAYRGYFSEKSAHRYAERLKGEGYDVFVSGVSTYSTLGWFDDPAYNTLIDLPEAWLAALIFHELAHQILYVKDDTTFNESFATAVEQEGLRRWMTFRSNREAYHEYMQAYGHRRQFNQLIIKYRRKLELLYQKALSLEEKRHQKEFIILRLREDYLKQKQEWKGYAGYDHWFENPINNAQINTVSIYNELVPVFLNLMNQCGGDLVLFYETCQTLAGYDKEERIQKLNEKLEKGMN